MLFITNYQFNFTDVAMLPKIPYNSRSTKVKYRAYTITFFMPI